MNYDDYSTYQPTTNRVPLMLGVAGAMLGALAFGFVIASAVGKNTAPQPPEPASAAAPAVVTETPSPATTQQPSPVATQPVPATPVPPTATLVPPTATPIPPTATPTVPAITSPKFLDFYRAEGGSTYKSTKTLLPFRRADASWDNSYKDCPGPGCIRGKVSVWTGLGPLSVAESPSSSATVYNTFTAQRSSANLLMTVKWSTALLSLASANSDSQTKVEVIVSQIDPKTKKVVKAVPGMPYSVMSESLGLQAIQGLDKLSDSDTRKINVPLHGLTVGANYRIELKASCATRAAFSISATTCATTAEWTTMAVEFDKGLCAPSQTGNGCIYTKD